MFMVKTGDRFASEERLEAFRASDAGKIVCSIVCERTGRENTSCQGLRRGPVAEARLRLKRMWLPLDMLINEYAIPMESFKRKKSRRTRSREREE